MVETSKTPIEIQEEYIAFLPTSVFGRCLLFPMSKMTPEIQVTITLFCTKGYGTLFTDKIDENCIMKSDCIQIQSKYGQPHNVKDYKVIQIVPVEDLP